MGDATRVRRRNRRTPTLPANVIRLDKFRVRAERSQKHTLFYLTRRRAWLRLLESFPFLAIEAIGSELELKAKLLTHTPDLILVEANLVWGEPVKMIKMVTSLLDVPTVLIYRPEDLEKKPALLKDAFAVGLHDTVCAPMKREELWETLDVLLKARRRLGS